MALLNNAENYLWSNISGSVSGFILKGGAYGVTVKATSYGSVTLQKLSGDGSTYVDCLTAFTANGYQSVNLPRGNYKLALSSMSGAYIDITAILATE